MLLIPFVGFSQLRYTPNQEDHDDKSIRFGINFGYNQSHFNFSHSQQFLNQLSPPNASTDSVLDIESVNSVGLNLAWLVNFNISPHFNVRTFPIDLTFSERVFEYTLTANREVGETQVMDKRIQSIVLSLPIDLEFCSDRIGNFKVYTIGGVRADYDLTSNSGDVNNGETVSLKKFNYSVEGGVGFHLYFPYFVLSPELKLDWGLSNLQQLNSYTKYSNNIDRINSRMMTFSLTVE
ncbi:MAG TPA: outer membrane beta-barrel protein [Ferruginibacter sp.]|nr:outer membrane beta-barrel protein [Ferruginibacter sp.]